MSIEVHLWQTTFTELCPAKADLQTHRKCCLIWVSTDHGGLRKYGLGKDTPSVLFLFILSLFSFPFFSSQKEVNLSVHSSIHFSFFFLSSLLFFLSFFLHSRRARTQSVGKFLGVNASHSPSNLCCGHLQVPVQWVRNVELRQQWKLGIWIICLRKSKVYYVKKKFVKLWKNW